MIIQHNMAAANANRMLGSVVTTQSKSTEKLSSGYRINRAADDAAGLSISEKMRGQIRGLDQASTNAQDGISMIQTAEGALNETHSILQRMRELAVQASTGTETDDDRAAIQSEITELQDEIDRIGNTTQFNTMNLLDGSMGEVFDVDAAKEAVGAMKTGDVLTIGTDKYTKGATNWTKDLSGAATSLSTIKGMSFGSGDVIKDTSDSSKVYTHDGSAFKNASDTFDPATMLEAGDKFTKNGESEITVTADTEDVSNASLEALLVNGASITIGAGTAKEIGAASTTSTFVLQVGANKGQTISFSIDDMRTKALGVDSTKVNCKTQTDAQSAIKTIDDAIKSVSAQRSNLGAKQNRLEHTIANLDTSSENLQTAESRIRDVDMAKEMVTYSKNNILQQAAQSMLAQANQSTQGVLSLLQ